jgi:hypothetical protein
MKKMQIIIILITILVTQSFSAVLIGASDSRAVTDKTTKEVVSKFITSTHGQKAYNEMVNLLNEEISKIVSGGFYDTLKITYTNIELDKKIEAIMLPLNHQEQDILRQKLINDLMSKGYKVTYNQFWDNPNCFNVSISW